MNNLPENTEEVKLEILKQTETDKRVYGFLLSQRSYWAEKRGLQPDGSFYVNNKKIRKITHVSDSSIHRAKKHLAKIGLIKYRSGDGRGHATTYSILDGLHANPPLTPEKAVNFFLRFGEESAKQLLSGEGYSQEEITTARNGLKR